MANEQRDYEGIPLIPRNMEVARILAGERGKERLGQFEKALTGYNSKAQETLKVYSINSAGKLVGSNVFARALLDTTAPEGTRGANIAELLRISDQDSALLSGTYEDVNSAVLRTLEDPQRPANTYLGKTLAKKLGIRQIKNPLVITNLTVKDDERSEYGLILVPSKKTQVIDAPQLVGKNNQRKFTLYDNNGLPIFNEDTDKTGKRQVWTRDAGLSRLYLIRNLNLYSNNENLALSNDVGRVVEISDEVADANFAQKLDKIYKAQQSELLQRFEQAKKVLGGNQ